MVLLALSGGLDSTMAAYLLREAGHGVYGLFLFLQEGAKAQLAKRQVLDAATELSLPLTILDLRRSFSRDVMEPFLHAYQKGLTPNPCARCNPLIKFKALNDYAEAFGFDHIATGHYAEISYQPDLDEYYVRRPKDASKDQTYVLAYLRQPILKKIIFPLADYCKTDLRTQAQALHYHQADQAESQDICFVPQNLRDFFKTSRLTNPSGNFVDSQGNILGPHKGLMNYTLGQSRHLGIALGERVYVTEINPFTRTITLGKEEDLAQKTIYLRHLSLAGPKTARAWMAPAPSLANTPLPPAPLPTPASTPAPIPMPELTSTQARVPAFLETQMMTRYRSQLRPVTLSPHARQEGENTPFIPLTKEEKKKIMADLWAGILPDENVVFEARAREAFRAPTPGQLAVFYQDDLLLGGATICKEYKI